MKKSKTDMTKMTSKEREAYKHSLFKEHESGEKKRKADARSKMKELIALYKKMGDTLKRYQDLEAKLEASLRLPTIKVKFRPFNTVQYVQNGYL